MARISTYALDAKPNLADKVLGTNKSPGEANQTKNYSLNDMVKMFNKENAIAIAGQAIFEFQSDKLLDGRDSGCISFRAGEGEDTPFQNIGELFISIKNSGNKRIIELLQTMVKSRIILCQTDDINNFGAYYLDNLLQDSIETDFYVATLAPDPDMVNGVIKKNKYYAIAEYFKQDAFEVWDQSSASNVWAITHTLDKKPSITVVDSGDNKVYGKIDYIDNNNLTITFNAAFSGKAYLN